MLFNKLQLSYHGLINQDTLKYQHHAVGFYFYSEYCSIQYLNKLIFFIKKIYINITNFIRIKIISKSDDLPNIKGCSKSERNSFFEYINLLLLSYPYVIAFLKQIKHVLDNSNLSYIILVLISFYFFPLSLDRSFLVIILLVIFYIYKPYFIC